MKKYDVTLYYRTSTIVTVEADSEREAEVRAYELATELDEVLLDNLEIDKDADVELIEED